MKNLELMISCLAPLDDIETMAINGGQNIQPAEGYMPGAGAGGIGPELTKEQAKYLFHEIGQFFQGFWDGL